MQATAIGGAGNYSYSWSPTIGLNNAGLANPIASPATSTTYVLSVTDGTGSVVRDTVSIVVNAALYKPVISLGPGGANPFCEGQFILLFASNSVSYQWSNGSTSNGISVATSDTFRVTSVSTAGCIGTSDPYIAIMKPRTPAPTISPAGTAAFCIGGAIALSAQNSQNPVSYLWNTGATTASITTQNAGTYSVTATGPNGCTSLAAAKMVIVNNLPTGAILVNGSANLCSGDSVQLTVSTAIDNSVLWNTGAVTKSIWVKTGGVYSAQLTSPQGCTGSPSNVVTIQVLSRPNPSISQNTNELIVIQGAATYQWYINNTPIAAATGQTLTITQGGNYRVDVTAVNGCSASANYGAILRVANPVLNYQVYPNPSKGKLDISYSLHQSERVTITVKNLQGQNFLTIIDQQQNAGDFHYSINTTGLPRGLILIEFKIGEKIFSHKQLLL